MKTTLGWGKALAYARFLAAGAIGGVAVINTLAQLAATTPAPRAEHIAMAVGAMTLALAAKVFHVV